MKFKHIYRLCETLINGEHVDIFIYLFLHITLLL